MYEQANINVCNQNSRLSELERKGWRWRVYSLFSQEFKQSGTVGFADLSSYNPILLYPQSGRPYNCP